MKRLLSIGRWRPWRVALCVTCLGASLVAYADDSAQVTITQVDSDENSLADAAYGSTEAAFTSVTAPARDGKRFIYWSVDPADTPNFVNRDAWGRALNQVSVVPKGDTTLTAHYADAATDADGDGIPDADEVYWYGDLDEGIDSDTDGDGYTFKQELQYGMNPLFPNALVLGGINYGDSDTFWYNPNGYTPYTIQTNTDGTIEVVEVSYLAPGVSKTTGTYTAEDGFAYWLLNGVPQTDAFGRALDTVTFVGTGEAEGNGIVAEAVLLSDADARAIAYWYGINTDKTMASDTDGDGYTLAQELQYGMNPHFKNELVLGGVNYGDSETFWYNPNQYSPYLIQTDTDGVLAEVDSGFLKIGQSLTTASYAGNASFHYWMLNGTRQADAFGRACDQVTLTGTGSPDESQVATAILSTAATADERAIAYWYGPDSGITADSDTDGDGYTLAQEVQYGMSPHFKNQLVLGGVNYGDGPTLETNLQPFDMGSKAVVDGNVVDFFATLDGMAGNLTGGLDFNGAMVTPAIVDANGDGNFDLVVATPTAITLYKNIGAAGAPNFTAVENVYSLLLAQMETMERPTLVGGTVTVGDAVHPALWLADQGGAVYCYDITADTLTATGATGFPVWQTTFGTFAEGTLTLADATTLSCDAAPAGVTSVGYADANQDEVADLLVADDQGRISLYTQANGAFALRHRVWGGSYVGFATGLAIAPVDWDNDGDLDAVCGTSDGHLLLLSDPGIGRPMNLSATAGYDNVLLQWDPNKQSRVSGYGVYRADSAATDFTSIADVQLPTHRDTPPTIAEWAYRVTAKSRLWKAGNSIPEIFESMPSEVVRVDLGGVQLSMPETCSSYDNAEIEISLFIDNSMGISAQNLTLTVTYDADKLEYVGYTTTALTEQLLLATTSGDESFTLTSSGGVVEPGSGKLFGFKFNVKQGISGEATVALTDAVLYATDGVRIGTNALPLTTTVTIKRRPVPSMVTLSMADTTATTLSQVEIPVQITTVGDIDWTTVDLTPSYDEVKLTLVSRTVPTAEDPVVVLTFDVLEQHGDNLFTDTSVSGIAMSANGLPATVGTASCRIQITDSNPPKPSVVTLSMTDTTAATLSQVEIPVQITTVGDIDWSTVALTSTFDSSKLTLLSQSGPSAEDPVVVLTFDVLEQHGDNLFADISVSGTAMSANGLPATVGTASCRIQITDSNPPKPSLVTLSMADTTAETLTKVEIPVQITTVGDLDWSTFDLTASYDEAKLTLDPQSAPSAENPVVILTFNVLEQHGDNLFADISVSGSAVSANGLPATVGTASCRIQITDSNPPKPSIVTLSMADATAETLSQINVPIRITTVGDIDWSTVALTSTFDSSKLTLLSQSGPSAEDPVVVLTFDVLEQHGDNLFADISVSGTAMSANGLSATVGTASCRIQITDSNPPKPSVVTLSMSDATAATLSQVELPVQITTVGELDWTSVALTPTFDSTKLTLLSQTAPSAEDPVVVLTFDVLEQHGTDLFAEIKVIGTAVSANGLPATVGTASCRILVTDSNPPVASVVSLQMNGMSVTTLSQIEIPVQITTVGDLDWSTVALTSTFDSSKLTLLSQTAPSAEDPVVVLTFDVLEQHGDNLFADISVIGTAMSANGLPATVGTASCRIQIADSNPPKPSVVTLSMTDTTAATLSQIEIPVQITTIGDLDWSTVALTPTFDSSKLTLDSQSGPSAEDPVVVLTFDVLEQHGDNLFTDISVSGIAMSANGLPATVGTASCRIQITDSNPPKPSVVTLSMTDTTAATLSQVEIPVQITTVGDIDWSTVALTSTFDSSKLTLLSQSGPSAEDPVVVLTFDVLEQHGDNLFADISVSGSAVSANGLPATVGTASCRIQIADSNPPKPSVVTLSMTDTTAATLSQIEIPVQITTIGDLDWSTVALTPTFDSSKLTLDSQSGPSAEDPVVILTFDVLEQHGDNLFADISVSGTAMSANGLPATVGTASCQIQITDSNPPEPSDVKLSMTDTTAATLSQVEIPVQITTVGDLDWATVDLTPSYDEAKLTLVSRTVPTAENPVATLTFDVLEQHGDNLFADISVSGTAMSANGLPATVGTASCQIQITDSNPPPPDPTIVPPWENGDCDGDGKLTKADYQAAQQAITTYHTMFGQNHTKHESNEDWKIHLSIVQAVGYEPADKQMTAWTRLLAVLADYYEDHGVELK